MADKVFADLESGKMKGTRAQTIILFLMIQSYILYDLWLIYVSSRYVMKKVENDPFIQHQYGKKSPLAMRGLSVSSQRVFFDL